MASLRSSIGCMSRIVHVFVILFLVWLSLAVHLVVPTLILLATAYINVQR